MIAKITMKSIICISNADNMNGNINHIDNQFSFAVMFVDPTMDKEH